MHYRLNTTEERFTQTIVKNSEAALTYLGGSTIPRHVSLWPLDPAPLWPPSPTLLCCCYPIINTLYARAYGRLSRYVLDGKPATLALPRPIRRLIWAFGGDVEGAAIHIDIQRDDPQDQLPAQPGDENIGGDAADGQNNVEVAEHTVRITGSSLGRVLGSALALPAVARVFGSLLLRISRHSRIMRRILALRENITPTIYKWEFGEGNSNGGVIGAIKRAAIGEVVGTRHLSTFGALRIFFRTITFGHRVWLESDPVWWRNTLGLGLFIVVCVLFFCKSVFMLMYS
jgi:hypothetical protein